MSKLILSFFDQFPDHNGRKIEIRGKDGYFSATDMTACLNQTFSDWRRAKFATKLIARLAQNLRLPIDYGDSLNELLHEIDQICYEHRLNRSEFVREALTTYLKYFQAQAHKINPPNEESLAV